MTTLLKILNNRLVGAIITVTITLLGIWFINTKMQL